MHTPLCIWMSHMWSAHHHTGPFDQQNTTVHIYHWHRAESEHNHHSSDTVPNKATGYVMRKGYHGMVDEYTAAENTENIVHENLFVADDLKKLLPHRIHYFSNKTNNITKW